MSTGVRGGGASRLFLAFLVVSRGTSEVPMRSVDHSGAPVFKLAAFGVSSLRSPEFQASCAFPIFLAEPSGQALVVLPTL